MADIIRTPPRIVGVVSTPATLAGDVTIPRTVGATNYEVLTNKPSINGVELIGDKSSAQIKVQDPMDAMTVQEIERILYT